MVGYVGCVTHPTYCFYGLYINLRFKYIQIYFGLSTF